MAELNTAKLAAALQAGGLSQADVAKKLSVSREAVSKWLKGVASPRPDKLLRLGRLVGLGVSDLLLRGDQDAPVVAFRKKGAAKTTAAHIGRAGDMGRLLRPLVPYLPFDQFVGPEKLKNPSADYGYIQGLVSKIRREMAVDELEPIDFAHLVKRFTKTQTVLVPVLWGKKGNHENALHIFLPDSMTTWVYLNLDVEIHDFKFWMAHELGHVLAPELRGDVGEDFADCFAGALLMPRAAAACAYLEITKTRDAARRINRIKAIAEKFLISPYGVYVQVNSYAASQGLQELNLEPAIHGACRNLSKLYYSVSESLFGEGGVDPVKLISFAKDELGSPVFAALADYIRERKLGPGIIQTALNVPVVDAIELHRALN